MSSHHYKWHHGHIHYDKRGLGDPLVLIHNVYPGASHEEYYRNLSELARHYTVYALDLLGFGDSDKPRLRYAGELMVELIFDFLREVVAEPAHVVSAGLSCAYVTEVAAWRENLFDRLVFVCPRSEPTGLDTPRWFAPIKHFFLSTPPLSSGFYETMTGDYEIKQFLLRNFHNPRAVSEELVQRLQENAAQPGTIYPYASLLTGYMDRALLEHLPKVRNPILLIWGRQARPTPVEHSVRLIALAQRSRLEVIEPAGAWVHDEQSARVNALILRFLADQIELSGPGQISSR